MFPSFTKLCRMVTAVAVVVLAEKNGRIFLFVGNVLGQMFCMNTSFDLSHSAVVHTQHICKIYTYMHYKLFKYFKVGKIIIPFTSGVTGSDPLSGFPR